MYKILVVEDDETIVQIVKRHLQSWGYEVFQVEDFAHVIQEFVQKDPQPGASGSEAAFLQRLSLVRGDPEDFPGSGFVPVLSGRQHEYGYGHEPWRR